MLGWPYLVSIVLWFGLRLLFFDRFWWLALLNTLAFYLFLPLAILLPLALWGRQRRLVFGLLFPCLLFLSLFQPLINPLAKATRPAQTTPALKVMSFNMLGSNHDYPKIAQMIGMIQPDLIGLQEVRSEQMAALVAALAPAYRYQALHPADRFHTVGLLSRLPIDTITALPNPPMERGLQVTVRNGTQQLAVLIVHLAPNNMPLWPLEQFVATTIDRYTQRAAEVNYLHAVVQKRALPTLILCDCNMTDTSETYAQLQTVVADSFQERGWGLGHTLSVTGVPFPVQRVDYIWHTDELHVIDAFIGTDGGSDHLPMIATFSMPTP
jgi:endonuclease/exonuclease/phosphatase (EEP) superfamily protein YafD